MFELEKEERKFPIRIQNISTYKKRKVPNKIHYKKKLKKEK